MLGPRCLRGVVPLWTTTARPSMQTARLTKSITSITTRPLSILTNPSLRPVLPRPTFSADSPSTLATSDGSSNSSSPLLPTQQIRGAKRDTYNPSHVVRKRRHGFLARKRTRTGRAMLKRRRMKGRGNLSH